MDLQGIVNKVKNWFNWTPVLVSEPVAVYKDYLDKGHVLLGYEVTVTYMHQGERKYLFAHDEDKLGIVTSAQAHKNAVNFYREKLKQIKGR